MKALVFVIIAAGFTGVCFAQNCGLVEADADVSGTSTWYNLKYYVIENAPNPDHWKKKRADYWINSGSCPAGGVAAINAAASTWNASSWKGNNDFTLNSRGSTPEFAKKKDGMSVIAFQNMPPPHNGAVARAYVMDYEIRVPWHWHRNRLKEVDVIFDVNTYWATGPKPAHYDIESVALHEFGHFLALNDLERGPSGCDEFIAAVMYERGNPGVVQNTLHWIDKWGKWYIYSSGNVAMAPSGMPIERIPPPPLQSDMGVLHTRLLSNYPNPFNPETWIPYQLADNANVSIDIYDSDGALVRHFRIGKLAPGSYVERAKAAHWDGKDSNGQEVASGVYFYTLQADDFSQTRRMVILK